MVSSSLATSVANVFNFTACVLAAAVTTIKSTNNGSRDTHDAWHASPKPTHWLNQFARENEANIEPFISMSKHWNAFSFRGLYPGPPHQGSAKWRMEGLKDIITYPLSKPIFSQPAVGYERRQFSKNVATRGVLTRLESSKIVFPGSPTRTRRRSPRPHSRLGRGIPPRVRRARPFRWCYGLQKLHGCSQAFLKPNWLLPGIRKFISKQSFILTIVISLTIRLIAIPLKSSKYEHLSTTPFSLGIATT